MTTLRFPRAFRTGSRRMALVIGGMALMVGYILLLNHEERVMEAYYADLRESDVELYLDKILQARGFQTYLEEYLEVHDYTRPTTEAPPFLVGRWSLTTESRRVSDTYLPESCANGLEIEDGRVKQLGTDGTDRPVRYTMRGDRATAHLDSGKAIQIDVVGYGNHLHHLEIRDPALDGLHYGYMCR